MAKFQYSSDGSPVKVKPKTEDQSSTIVKSKRMKILGDIITGATAILLFLPTAQIEIKQFLPDLLHPVFDALVGVGVVLSLYSRWTISQRRKTGAPIQGTEGEFQARTVYNVE